MAKPTCDDLTIEWGTADAQTQTFSAQKEPAPSSLRTALPEPTGVAELHLRPGGAADALLARPICRAGAGRVAPHRAAIPSPMRPAPDGEIILQIARIDGLGTSQWVHETLLPGTVLVARRPLWHLHR
jgi:CDP-4-dehydro-6-deoxyglucose reductase